MRNKLILLFLLLFAGVKLFAEDDMIKNGNFEKDMQNWKPNPEAMNSLKVDGGVLSFDYSGGKNAYLEQKIASLSPGEEYVLTFSAKVIRGGDATFGCVMITNANWGPSETFIPRGDWTDYTKTFKAKVPYDRVIIRVKGNASLQIKNICLKKKVTEKAVSAEKDMIKNGNFEKDIQNWKPNPEAMNSLKVDGGVLSFDYSGGKNAYMEQKTAPLVKGEEYVLTFSAKVIRGGDAEFGCVMITNANWGPSETFIPRGDWTDYTKTFKAKAPYDRVIIRVKGNASLQIKNICLKKKLTEKPDMKNDKIVSSVTQTQITVGTSGGMYCLKTKGGKLSSASADGKEWAFQNADDKVQGIGKLWFENLDLKNDTSMDFLLRPLKTDDQEQSFTAEAETSLLSIRKTYTFTQSPRLGIRVELKNKTTHEIEFGVKLHNSLDFCRTVQKQPLFRLYASTSQGVAEYLMTRDCPSDINAGNAAFFAVVGNDRKSVIFSSPEPGDYYTWVGMSGHPGTVEREFKNVRLQPGAKFSFDQNIFFIAGLPSVSMLNSDFAFSLANPEFSAVALRNMPNFSGVLQIEGGGSYPLNRNRLDAGALLSVPLSAIADPGKRIFKYDSNSVSVPSSCSTFPKDDSLALPYGFVNMEYRPAPEAKANSLLYFPSDNYQNKIYVSPDAVSMIAWGQSVNGRVGGDIWLHFHAPAGIDVIGGRFIKKVEELAPETRNGIEYKHYRIKIAYGTEKSRGGVTEMIVRCNIPAPAKLPAYYATEVNGSVSGEGQAELNIISIPEAGVPKQMSTVFWGLHGTLDAFPDGASFRRIGLGLPNDDFLNNIIKKGVLAKHTPAQGYIIFKSASDGSKCIGRDGSRNGHLACPSDRGEDFEKVLDAGRRAIDDGVFRHGFDPERVNGNEICFCERCISQFAAYAGEKNIALPAPLSRESLVPALEKDPAIKSAWLDFKVKNECDKYRLYREAMLDHMKKKGIDTGKFRMALAAQPGWEKPKAIMASSLQDPAVLKKIFDSYEPMIYIDINGRFSMKTDMQEIPREIAALYRVGGYDLPLVPIISVGYPYTDFIGNIEPGVMKAQILEAFAAGARGLTIYSEGWYDALDMKETSEAMRVILKAEDVFLKGIPIPEARLTAKSGNVFVKGLELENGNAVILVSDYSTHVKKASVIYRINGSADITDMETGEKIGTITSDNSEFNVVLDKNRTRMLRVKGQTF